MAEEILEKINFHSDNGRSFTYDPSTGFIRSVDGEYLLFRAEAPGTVVGSRGTDLNEELQASYGPGIYTGNTPESVAPFSWTRPDNVINAYLTPSLETGDIYAHPKLSSAEAAINHLKNIRQRNKLGWRAVSALYDKRHGDSHLAVLDPGFDVKSGQKLLSRTQHTIDPRWGVWRKNGSELTQIGTAEANSHPYSWALKAANKVYRK